MVNYTIIMSNYNSFIPQIFDIDIEDSNISIQELLVIISKKIYIPSFFLMISDYSNKDYYFDNSKTIYELNLSAKSRELYIDFDGLFINTNQLKFKIFHSKNINDLNNSIQKLINHVIY